MEEITKIVEIGDTPNGGCNPMVRAKVNIDGKEVDCHVKIPFSLPELGSLSQEGVCEAILEKILSDVEREIRNAKILENFGVKVPQLSVLRHRLTPTLLNSIKYKLSETGILRSWVVRTQGFAGLTDTKDVDNIQKEKAEAILKILANVACPMLLSETIPGISPLYLSDTNKPYPEGINNLAETLAVSAFLGGGDFFTHWNNLQVNADGEVIALDCEELGHFACDMSPRYYYYIDYHKRQGVSLEKFNETHGVSYCYSELFDKLSRSSQSFQEAFYQKLSYLLKHKQLPDLDGLDSAYHLRFLRGKVEEFYKAQKRDVSVYSNIYNNNENPAIPSSENNTFLASIDNTKEEQKQAI